MVFSKDQGNAIVAQRRLTPAQYQELREIGKQEKRPWGTWARLGREWEFDPTYLRRLALGLPIQAGKKPLTYGNPPRTNRGVENPSAKLTEDEVREIRRIRRQPNPPSYRAMAAKLSEAKKVRITDTTVYCAANGLSWKHLPME